MRVALVTARCKSHCAHDARMHARTLAHTDDKLNLLHDIWWRIRARPPHRRRRSGREIRSHRNVRAIRERAAIVYCFGVFRTRARSRSVRPYQFISIAHDDVVTHDAAHPRQPYHHHLLVRPLLAGSASAIMCEFECAPCCLFGCTDFTRRTHARLNDEQRRVFCEN